MCYNVQSFIACEHKIEMQYDPALFSPRISMVAYFCHHMSDNYVDLSDNYIDLSDLYVDLSDHYVDLSDNFVVICMALIGQEHVLKINF